MKFMWFCASGEAFFYGVAIVAAALLLSVCVKTRRLKLLVCAGTVVGAFGVVVSGTPLAWWVNGLWGVVALGWLIVYVFSRDAKRRPLKLWGGLAFCITIMALVLELPFHFKQSIPEGTYNTLYVIGDSISAGLGDRQEKPWPQVIQAHYGVEVVNLAQAGATAGSAIGQAVRVKEENAMVLLEIGGNDLLGGTPNAEFEEDLRKILERVSGGKRTVVMLELPLMPGRSAYGRIQRKLAKEFAIVLVPKRYFAEVLSTEGATTDLVHLSPKGHDLMAATIWRLIESPFEAPAKAEK